MNCEDCANTWGGNPPCEECKKPDLLAANKLAVRVWQICHSFGRDGLNGSMKIESILQTLEALGGVEEDIEKIMLIETKYQKLNPKEDKNNG